MFKFIRACAFPVWFLFFFFPFSSYQKFINGIMIGNFMCVQHCEGYYLNEVKYEAWFLLWETSNLEISMRNN